MRGFDKSKISERIYIFEYPGSTADNFNSRKSRVQKKLETRT